MINPRRRAARSASGSPRHPDVVVHPAVAQSVECRLAHAPWGASVACGEPAGDPVEEELKAELELLLWGVDGGTGHPLREDRGAFVCGDELARRGDR